MPKTERPFRVGFLIHDVSRLRRTVVDKALRPLGVTRSQWWVLANLSRHNGGGMMQTELSKVMDVGKVTLGGLIDRLEALEGEFASVEAQLSNDKGRDKANPAAPTVKISDTNQNGVRTSNVAQPGDPVQDVAEQTIEPTANRDAVRAFFKSAGDTSQPQTP